MQRYKNLSHESGVIAYEIRSSGIILQFADGSRYLYTYASTGRDHVQEMKQLAAKGRGLTTYVNQHVGSAYAMRLA
jgi:hypothetical protein